MRKILRKGKPLTSVPVKKVFLASDIENDPKTGKFICGHFFGHTRDHHGKIRDVNKYCDNEEKYLAFAKNLKPESCTLIFFNLSYDYPFLKSITEDDKLLIVGSRFIAGKIENGVKMMDISNHATDGALKDWIEWLKFEEKHGIKKESLDNKEIRVKSDTHATWLLAEFIQDFYIKQFKIPLKLTLASQSRSIFTQYYFTDYWYRDNEVLDAMERESYRGGRTEVFRRGKNKVWSYDVNSMYLSVMKDELIPDPSSAKIYNNIDKLPDSGLYIAKCTIDVPKQYIGPLPYYTDKLLFPTGEITGAWCSPELEYAVKECGCVIKNIEWCITYKSKPYFQKIASMIWDERKKFKAVKNKGMDLMIKKIGNSLYGGFGQRNNLLNFVGKTTDIDIPEGANVKIDEINGIKYCVVTSAEKEDSSHTFTCVPSFITSYARLKFLKKAREHKYCVVYGDTDSLKFTKNLHERYNIELGEWGYEKDKSGEWFFHKPKMYGRKRRGMIEKMKGIPKESETRKVVITHEDKHSITFAFEKPNRMKESIRRGLVINQWCEMSKTVSKKDDKRVWKNNTSMPIKILGGEQKKNV